MRLFVKNEGLVHGNSCLSISTDLYYALSLISKNGTFEDYSLAMGEHEDLLFSEVKSKLSSNISMAIFDKKKQVLKGFRMDATTHYAAPEKFSENNHLLDRIATIALAIRCLDLSLNENEFIDFERSHSGILSQEEEYELSSIMQSIEVILTNRLLNEKSEIAAIQKPPQEINISQVETGMLSPSKIIFGTFEGFKSRRKNTNSVKLSDIKDKFVLNPDRTFSPAEKDMMFNVPKYYSVSSNVLSLAEKIKSSWDKDPNLRKVNILMEGPAGTGKTLDSKVLSSLLGLPYTKITCFSDMDSSDVTGAILPVANEDIDLPIPSDDEIFFDPAGCYERLTGKKLGKEEAENISEADVREAINDAYADFYEREGNNSPRYVYYASEIVKAFENGYLCEIQEPTCIADAAVLLVLNSALEKEGVINLAQRTVKRHPECIFVMTTNRDYEGCRPLNQALRDRFNITKKVALPSVEEQMERLSSATGCNDEEFLRTVVESVTDLNKFLGNEGINASISLRGMQDFVADVMNGFDLRESVMEDLIYKISTDDSEVAEMESFLEVGTNLLTTSYYGGKNEES